MNHQRPLVHGARPHQAWVPNDDSWQFVIQEETRILGNFKSLAN